MMDKEEAIQKGLYNVLGSEMDDKYIDAIKKNVLQSLSLTLGRLFQLTMICLKELLTTRNLTMAGLTTLEILILVVIWVMLRLLVSS